MSVTAKHSPARVGVDRDVGDGACLTFQKGEHGHAETPGSHTRSRSRVHYFLNQKYASEANPATDTVSSEKETVVCERPRSMSLPGMSLVESSLQDGMTWSTPHPSAIEPAQGEEQQVDLEERLHRIQIVAEAWKEKKWSEVHKGYVEKQAMESAMSQRIWQSRIMQQNRALRRIERLVAEMRSKLHQDM
ncbi:unnamed protein product [Phytomonas sp. EM1]|nr:unnamed protein product [Phytomonas sp. EM1]|eukprot:CCW63062.1 unnamed protein product [Phytomonas sp. isolate EM1]